MKCLIKCIWSLWRNCPKVDKLIIYVMFFFHQIEGKPVKLALDEVSFCHNVWFTGDKYFNITGIILDVVFGWGVLPIFYYSPSDNNVYVQLYLELVCINQHSIGICINPFVPTVPTFAVRETASLGIMGEPRVPPLNPSKTIVLWEHYRLWGV